MALSKGSGCLPAFRRARHSLSPKIFLKSGGQQQGIVASSLFLTSVRRIFRASGDRPKQRLAASGARNIGSADKVVKVGLRHLRQPDQPRPCSGAVEIEARFAERQTVIAASGVFVQGSDQDDMMVGTLGCGNGVASRRIAASCSVWKRCGSCPQYGASRIPRIMGKVIADQNETLNVGSSSIAACSECGRVLDLRQSRGEVIKPPVRRRATPGASFSLGLSAWAFSFNAR